MGIFGNDWWDFNAAQAGVFRGGQIMLYTVNGAGVDMFTGYPADMARALCNAFPFFAWQPVAFDPKPAPMKPGILQGTIEHVRQLSDVHPTGPWMGIYYSEGSIIGANVLDVLRDQSSPIAGRFQDCLAVVALGNPRREEGNVAPGCIDPGGFGIVTPNTVDTPAMWWNFANGPTVPGSTGWDLYATCSGAKAGSVELKDMRDVWQTVYSGSPGAIAKLIGSSLLPWNWVGAFAAIGAAGSFFGSATMPHVDYQTSYPILGDPRDAWAIGFDYLAAVGSAAVASRFQGTSPVQPSTPDQPLFPPVR